MDVQEVAARQAEGGIAITTRIGVLMLALAVPVLMVAEYFHPHKEAPMDFPAVFTEYAHSRIWTTVHLGEYFGFLLLLGGLVAPFGLAAAVTTVASYMVLQAVDGMTLKRAVDAWTSAQGRTSTPPSPQRRQSGGSRWA